MFVRRRIHFRSLSDVTPASRAHTPRARSHSERPRDGERSPPASPLLSPPPAPARRAHSERSSPNASLVSVAAERARSDTDEAPPTPRRRHDAVTIVGNPWRKMSEADLKSGGKRSNPLRSSFDKAHANDPWIRDRVTHPKTPENKKAGNRNVFRGVPQNIEPARAVGESERSEPKREAGARRGKLERKSPVVCDSCGNESCECWRPRSPRCPRTPRPADARGNAKSFDMGRKSPAKAEGGAGEGGAGLLCTCEAAPRSPRPSPARLAPGAPPLAPAPSPAPAPARSLSADDRSRSLSHSQQVHDPRRVVCSNDVHNEVKKPADPLLETTC